MAFLRKAGSLLRQTTGKPINSLTFAANPSVFQIIRCMSSSKIFIGGLSFSTGDQSLGEAFKKYGDVQDARVIMDRETSRSRGFGFVTFGSADEASAAIQALNGQELDGRTVTVNYANEKPRGGGGYGGGYGAGGGGNFGGENYNQGGGNYNQGYNQDGGNYNQSYNQDGGNYNQSYNQGGGNYNQSGGNYNQ